MSIAPEQWMAERHRKGRMDGQARTLPRLLERHFSPAPDAPELGAVFADGTPH